MSIAEQAGLVLEPGPCIAPVFGLNESKSKMKIKSTKRITSKRLTPALRPRRADPAIHHVRRIVADLPHLPAVQIQPLLLVEMQRPRADAAEDADLVAALVHRPVAVQALGDGQGVAAVRNRIAGHKLRRRPRAEAVSSRVLAPERLFRIAFGD